MRHVEADGLTTAATRGAQANSLVRVTEDELAQLEISEADAVVVTLVDDDRDLMEQADRFRLRQALLTANIRVQVTVRRLKQDVRLLPSHEHRFNRIDAGISVHTKVSGKIVVVALRRHDLRTARQAPSVRQLQPKTSTFMSHKRTHGLFAMPMKGNDRQQRRAGGAAAAAPVEAA